MAKKSQLQIAIRNALLPGNVLELYFLDGIYDSWDWDSWDVTSLVQDVINKVNAARPSEIIAYINSEGGDCAIGLAIYNFLKYHSAAVETRTLALAGSIASVIAQAADPGRRYIAAAGHMVIHEAWGLGIGRAEELRQTADVIDTYTAAICNVYVETTGIEYDTVREMIRPGDYWMLGSSAVEQGFADATFDEMPAGFEVNNSLTFADLDEHYRNIPEEIQQFIKPGTRPQPPENKMKLPKLDFKAAMKKVNDAVRSAKLDPKSDTLADDVANVLADPLGEFADTIQKQIQDSLEEAGEAETAAVEKRIEDKLDKKYTDLITGLQNKIDKLEKDGDTLAADIADNTGGAADKGTQEKGDVVNVIGYGRTRGAAAE